MKIAVIGDPHLGCTTYTDRRISDFSKQFNLAINEALSRKVEVVFILGDVFDSSAYRRSVDSFAACLSEVAPSLVKLKELGIRVFAIGGNHEYGRGRGGGELRILSDLGIIQFLDDEVKEFNGFNVAGISWKSDPELFKQTLKKFGLPKNNSILLIHQFCEGSRLLPSFLAEVKKEDIKDWPVVFAGHHHQYEDLGYVIAPGSLEVHKADEVGQKGFVLYDTEARKYEFIVLKPSRIIHYTEISGDGRSAEEFQREIEKWIKSKASTGSLLVMKIDGTLTTGRSVDINWNHLRSIGYQAGCLKIHFEGGLRDQVRTVPEIRATVNFEEFIKKKFGSKAGLAIRYVQSFRDKSDEFSTEMLDGILQEVERMKKELAAYGNKDLVFKRINDECNFLGELQQTIDEFRINLRSSMKNDLENAVNFFMSKFSDGDFDAQLRITEDFGFEIFLHEHSVPLFNLSGAARDILALSIRYGLYRIASKEINFILLDEPTHHFDPTNTNKLKEALNELSDQQLIIITVHDEFTDAVGKKFIVEKNQELNSVIKEI